MNSLKTDGKDNSLKYIRRFYTHYNTFMVINNSNDEIIKQTYMGTGKCNIN